MAASSALSGTNKGRFTIATCQAPPITAKVKSIESVVVMNQAADHFLLASRVPYADSTTVTTALFCASVGLGPPGVAE